MRFLFPAAGAAVIVFAAVLHLSSGVTPAAAATPNAGVAADVSASGASQPAGLTSDSGRISGRDTVAPYFWKKFWKIFKSVIGGVITFIDGLIDELGGDPDDGLPGRGFAARDAVPAGTWLIPRLG